MIFCIIINQRLDGIFLKFLSVPEQVICLYSRIKGNHEDQEACFFRKNVSKRDQESSLTVGIRNFFDAL